VGPSRLCKFTSRFCKFTVGRSTFPFVIGRRSDENAGSGENPGHGVLPGDGVRSPSEQRPHRDGVGSRLAGVSGYFLTSGATSPTSMYCPPPVCLQWTAMTFLPGFSAPSAPPRRWGIRRNSCVAPGAQRQHSVDVDVGVLVVVQAQHQPIRDLVRQRELAA